MIPMMAGMCQVIMKIIRISNYCGGVTASITNRENNNPSEMFKWIHAAAIIR